MEIINTPISFNSAYFDKLKIAPPPSEIYIKYDGDLKSNYIITSKNVVTKIITYVLVGALIVGAGYLISEIYHDYQLNRVKEQI